MIRPCAKENERTSIEAKRRNSITDTFLRLRRDGMDCLPKFLKSFALIGIRACEVFVNRFGLAIGWSHKCRTGSFPCVTSLQFPDVDASSFEASFSCHTLDTRERNARLF